MARQKINFFGNYILSNLLNYYEQVARIRVSAKFFQSLNPLMLVSTTFQLLVNTTWSTLFQSCFQTIFIVFSSIHLIFICKLQSFKSSIVFSNVHWNLGVKWIRVIMFPLPHLPHGWFVPSNYNHVLSAFYHNMDFFFAMV